MDINDDYVGDRLINRSTAITRTNVPFMDEKLGWVPMAWEAYRVYRKGAISFSAHEALMIRAALAMPVLDPDDKPTWADMLSMREWKAFIQKVEQIK